MKNMTWSIGRKLAVGFAAVILLTLIVGAAGLFALNRVKTEVESTTTVSARLEALSNLINISLLEARRSEKDFFLHYKSIGIAEAKAEYVAKVQAHVADIRNYAAEGVDLAAEHQANHTAEDAHLVSDQVEQNRFRQIEDLIDHYDADFLQVVALVEQRGDADTGLEGQFRAKLNEMEEAATAAKLDRLTHDILTIRRHENDYLLRGDPSYIDQVTQSIAQFKQDLTATDLSTAEQTRQSALVDEYLALFQQFTQLDADLNTEIEHYQEDVQTIEALVAETRTNASQEFQDSVSRTNDTINIVTNWVEIPAVILAVLLGFGVAFGLARHISRPVGQLTEAARKLAIGDVNQKVEIQTRDEIGVMADAFSQMIAYQQQMAGVAGRLAQGDVTVNITPQSDRDMLGNAFDLMITNLRGLIGQVADTANTVNEASSQLMTAAEQAGQASQQVAATIQQVAQGTTQQTQSVTEATTNTEQLARAADGIARGAQEQAQGVQKTSGLVDEMAHIVNQVGQVSRSVTEANIKVTQAARQGVTAVGQTGQGMETIRVRTRAAAEKIKEMSHRSREIGRIIETIDDIADKTDMLALNAAVEAARAGEHGRGFAVVADQVRKLSEDSKGATRDIAELIERVQETIREAIGAMESTVTEVDHGTQLAGDTARSLEEILLAAEDAATLAGQIEGAVSQLRQKSEGVVTAMEAVSAVVEENTSVAEEMASGSQEVMQAMEGVASVAEENSASAEEVSASAEEMSAQVEEVVASAQELSVLAAQLRKAVDQFRVDEINPIAHERPTRDLSGSPVAANGQRSQVAAVMVSHHSNGYAN